MGPTTSWEYGEGCQCRTYGKSLFWRQRERKRESFCLLPGGTSFMGLVSRLYGERPHPTFEGIKTKRYLYHIYANKKPAGIAHASSFVYGASKVDVSVVYNTDGSIKMVLEHLSVTKELTAGNYLGQFEGRYTEDFEVVCGKRGKSDPAGHLFKVTKDHWEL